MNWIDERRRWALRLLPELDGCKDMVDIVISERTEQCLQHLDSTLAERQKRATALQRKREQVLQDSLGSKYTWRDLFRAKRKGAIVEDGIQYSGRMPNIDPV